MQSRRNRLKAGGKWSHPWFWQMRWIYFNQGEDYAQYIPPPHTDFKIFLRPCYVLLNPYMSHFICFRVRNIDILVWYLWCCIQSRYMCLDFYWFDQSVSLIFKLYVQSEKHMYVHSIYDLEQWTQSVSLVFKVYVIQSHIDYRFANIYSMIIIPSN